MNPTDIQKIKELYQTSRTWLKQYKEHLPTELKQEAKKVESIYKKTSILLKSIKEGQQENWSESLATLRGRIEHEALFAPCFSQTMPPETNLSKETATFTLTIQQEAAAWYAQYADNTQVDAEAIQFVAYVHEHCTQLLKEYQQGAEIQIHCLGAKKGASRKMFSLIKKLGPKYLSKVAFSTEVVEDNPEQLETLGIESLPCFVFKRKNKAIAKHQGGISESMLEQKIAVLLEGGNITDSSSAVNITDNKSVTKKELYSMNEFMMIYFDMVNCGICKMTGETVKTAALAEAGKVLFQSVRINGQTEMHQKFEVDKVPTTIFIRDGKEWGRHVGYINEAKMKEKMRIYSANGKVGFSESKKFSLVAELLK